MKKNNMDSNYANEEDFVDYVTYTGRDDNKFCIAVILVASHTIAIVAGMFLHHLLFK